MKTTEKLKWSEMSEADKSALVAEKVMEWKRWGDWSASWAQGVWDTGDPEDPTHRWFSPTANPADCAKVKERFRCRHWMMEWYPEHPTGPAYWACIYVPDAEGDIRDIEGTATTEEEAFCKAALRASGVEIED